MKTLASLMAGLFGLGAPPVTPSGHFSRCHHASGGTSVPMHKKKALNRRRNKEARAARRRNRN